MSCIEENISQSDNLGRLCAKQSSKVRAKAVCLLGQGMNGTLAWAKKNPSYTNWLTLYLTNFKTEGHTQIPSGGDAEEASFPSLLASLSAFFHGIIKKQVITSGGISHNKTQDSMVKSQSKHVKTQFTLCIFVWWKQSHCGYLMIFVYMCGSLWLHVATVSVWNWKNLVYDHVCLQQSMLHLRIP